MFPGAVGITGGSEAGDAAVGGTADAGLFDDAGDTAWAAVIAAAGVGEGLRTEFGLTKRGADGRAFAIGVGVERGVDVPLGSGRIGATCAGDSLGPAAGRGVETGVGNGTGLRGVIEKLSRPGSVWGNGSLCGGVSCVCATAGLVAAASTINANGRNTVILEKKDGIFCPVNWLASSSLQAKQLPTRQRWRARRDAARTGQLSARISAWRHSNDGTALRRALRNCRCSYPNRHVRVLPYQPVPGQINFCHARRYLLITAAHLIRAIVGDRSRPELLPRQP